MAADFDKGSRAYDAGDYAVALAELRPLAEQGDAAAQAILGTMYSLGEGVPQDHAGALKWYHKAAAQEDVLAQSFLSVIHSNGDGVPQDYVMAHMWCSLARAQEANIADYLTKAIADDLIKALENLLEQLETQLSYKQIATAQTIARQCLAQDYKDCDKL